MASKGLPIGPVGYRCPIQTLSKPVRNPIGNARLGPAMFKTTARNTQRRLDRQQLKDLPASEGAGSPCKPAARLVMTIQELERQISAAPIDSEYRAALERRLSKLTAVS